MTVTPRVQARLSRLSAFEDAAFRRAEYYRNRPGRKRRPGEPRPLIRMTDGSFIHPTKGARPAPKN